MRSPKGFGQKATLDAPTETRIAKQSKELAKGLHAYFPLRLKYQLMKYIQYRSNNATIPVQYGFSKSGFGNVLRYAITLIVTITESMATTIFRSLSSSILSPHFHKLIIVFFYTSLLCTIAIYIFIFHFSLYKL